MATSTAGASSLSRAALCRYSSKIRASCGNAARGDPCGGQWATAVPTATLLFRWFVGLNLDDEVWDVTVFTKNRERLLKADVASRFFHLVVKEAQALGLMSDEHFTVDGTLLEACASTKSDFVHDPGA